MNANRKAALSTLPDDLLAQILSALPATAPSAKRKASMKQSMLDRVSKLLVRESADTAAQIMLIRADEGHWYSFAPQVEMKVLHDDGATRSWLARFGPGGRVPAHIQSGFEEAIVMDG